MPFGKKNYMVMLGGIGVILLGFFIMSIDPEPFGFGFLGLTLGPLTVMAGFGIQFWAIFLKDNSVQAEAQVEEAAAKVAPAPQTSKPQATAKPGQRKKKGKRRA